MISKQDTTHNEQDTFKELQTALRPMNRGSHWLQLAAISVETSMIPFTTVGMQILLRFSVHADVSIAHTFF
ncbi:hypothetical protein GOP47_0024594 [Adiantum capillus-veneris]|uniref:Uncharacterized protein n=1 Tax=Adiantum capillus-veneris TaxID=13818 RepID=A0A9D4Z3T6_ADICA|nr:hypothetical protein GOP47_0024594 [Adiantum capillus-veneris]